MIIFSFENLLGLDDSHMSGLKKRFCINNSVQDEIKEFHTGDGDVMIHM